ncbi:hypothetical protein ACE5SX_18265, partial [Lactiplantibacillus plantarum]
QTSRYLDRSVHQGQFLWEKTNGLIREYFPKGTDLDELTDEDIAQFVRDLNNRPRKVLGWKTLSEVFFGKKLHFI